MRDSRYLIEGIWCAPVETTLRHGWEATDAEEAFVTFDDRRLMAIVSLDFCHLRGAKQFVFDDEGNLFMVRLWTVNGHLGSKRDYRPNATYALMPISLTTMVSDEPVAGMMVTPSGSAGCVTMGRRIRGC